MEPTKPTTDAKPPKEGKGQDDAKKLRGSESKPTNTFSYAEICFLSMFAIIADLVNTIPVVNIFCAIVTLFITQIYFVLKGVKWGYNLAMELVEFIPVVSILPAVTAGIVITIFITNSPRLNKAVQKATSAVKSKIPTPTS